MERVDHSAWDVFTVELELIDLARCTIEKPLSVASRVFVALKLMCEIVGRADLEPYARRPRTGSGFY